MLLLLLFEQWLVRIFPGMAAEDLTEDCSRGLSITEQNQRIASHADCACRFIHPRIVFPLLQSHAQLKIRYTA